MASPGTQSGPAGAVRCFTVVALTDVDEMVGVPQVQLTEDAAANVASMSRVPVSGGDLIETPKTTESQTTESVHGDCRT